jgi:flavin reductase (DIM6/NTAB) family NADH-FMN oxidoreductase RutF
MRVSSEQMHHAMAKFATGVVVISSLEANGDIHGMTANTLVSISLEPPLILVSIGHQRDTYANVQKQGCFGVNVLSRKQRKLVNSSHKRTVPNMITPSPHGSLKGKDLQG